MHKIKVTSKLYQFILDMWEQTEESEQKQQNIIALKQAIKQLKEQGK